MRTIVKKVAITGVALSSLVLAPLVVQAQVNDSEVTTINAIIDSTISITTSGAINLNVTPTIGGSQTSAADTVTVATNNSSGYTLTLADSDATTALVKSGDSIPAHSGTQAASSVLANDTWGYHVDSIGDFGTGGAAESNVASSSIKYAGVPATGGANTIRTGTGVTAGEVTTVYYGVKATTAKPNGTYSDTVTYTATTTP